MTKGWAGAALGAAVMACGWAGGASAAYIIDFSQVGTDVVVAGHGTLDLSGSTYRDTQTDFGPDGFSALYGAVYLGKGASYDEYTGITNRQSFGYGSGVSSGSTGDAVGFFSGATLPSTVISQFFVPAGYKSGAYLQSSDTFADTTLRVLGITAGTYTYSIGNDEFVINISTVPLPASAPLFGAALLGLVGIGYGVKRRRQARPA